ncbi:putative 1-acyl-sn-glycerol-3-phosphate acyltransferase acl-2 isoform X2 [Tribolium madens]|nr:putative 1-acyl-sn-glycerol-3-phosphate acyltransferase acl-2 isoform X2 [Tribolium madens]XP_044261935.1 putative 1-acyl-sn-glycerol-3-phosphate acyltransferase acl-2 isoform X2 [Tribolium madens]
MGLLLYTCVLMALLTLLYRTSSVARYYLKFIFFGISSCLLASAPIPLMLRRPRDPRNGLIPAHGIRLACRLIGVTTSLEGHENIVKDSGCVILMNHQSMLDLLILAELWPALDNCTVISKKEILYFQPFGLAAWLWGTIFIDRVKREHAQAAVNKTGETIRTRKARVLMFPEGTRNNKETLLRFKKGAFHVALASKCPIQPVVVNRYRFLGKHRFDDGHLRIKILPPISTEGYTVENMQELMDKTYKIMAQEVEVLTKEVDVGKKKKD